MTCEVYEDLISVYVDGELDHQNTKLVEAHIKQCESCMDVYQHATRFRQDMSSALRMHQFKIDVVSAVIEQIQPKRTRLSARVWIPAAAVLILAVCLFAALQLTSNKSASPGIIADKYNQKPSPRINMAKADQVSNPTSSIKHKILLTSTPRHTSKQVVQKKLKAKHSIGSKTTPMASKQAGVIIYYTDIKHSDIQDDNQYPLAPEPVPVAGPGQRLLAEDEIVAYNGRRLQRVCYRIVEDTDSAIRMGESHDDN
jgi:hypothetical protein